MSLSRLFGDSVVLCSLLVLAISVSSAPCGTCAPADERLEIDVELEAVEVEMPVSTQELTELNVLGWVDMSRKPPGETVTVEISLNLVGQYTISVGAYPDRLYFFYTGRQFFNVTLRMQEDTAPGKEYLVDVVANAEIKLAYDDDTFHFRIVTVPELWGDAEPLTPPADVRPGGTATGEVWIMNTGTRYVEYKLAVHSDPDDVVQKTEFNRRPVVAPNMVEKVPFDVTVEASVPPGEHTVVMSLLVVNDDGSTDIVDQFDVVVTIIGEEEGDGTPHWAIAAIVVIVLVPAAAFVLRRKA